MRPVIFVIGMVGNAILMGILGYVIFVAWPTVGYTVLLLLVIAILVRWRTLVAVVTYRRFRDP